MQRALIIDDTPSLISEIRHMLKGEYAITSARSPIRGIRRAISEEIGLVITTLKMREMGGLDVIRRLRSRGYQGCIVMVTAFGDASTAQEAIRLGATDYITRPLVAAELISRLARALKKTDSDSIPPLQSIEEDICTQDPEMIALLELAHLAANTDSRILILGETGTGKELLAKAIHRYSQRVKKPFIAINCAAIQESLLESELFGHEQGAFTGALSRRIGRFEQAGTGTLFLDEIGEISLALQSKLLRVLQDGEYYRVGGNQKLKSRARIVAATNQTLRQRVESGDFRADLFYRLNVVSLKLPPLRQRPGDVSLLANFFFQRFKSDSSLAKRFSERALEQLKRYNWPGNIRELEHLVERSNILIRKHVIELEDLPQHIQQAPQKTNVPLGLNVETALNFSDAKTRFEKTYFNNILEQSGGNYALAARMAGMERTVFYRKAKKLLAN
ncbi:sigma-54 dependent transcriptional regulator [Coraliomargarita algicola]|uniref:Sigma-54 dependent transcriptional regulator n=1 Tax=Coraliomargarita algicola TaxID=3092156 RepID=A0ABZ0RG29_9BACT|nr:sigma-54 dependent transcriptional regulator [Coraliomargarita sp. J2-16]WPJ94043.1 sigma-54 dependent transcriptional regulator [Coraliomargarita sp. J2-16]